MNAAKLKAVLENHEAWLVNPRQGSRADLSGANLSWASLAGADLRMADLSRANLTGANLTGASLTRADLSWANLTRANLAGANLTRANLAGANLAGADLNGANLTGANLTGATLRGATLRGADLSGADLSGADLTGADLSMAELREAALPNFLIVPEEGAFIGWKALANGQIAKLLIPVRARRTNSVSGRKCRASYVKVLALHGNATVNGPAQGTHYALEKGQEYKVGKIVRPDKYDPDVRVECTHGIHFFLTKKEAEEWLR
jgi:hypothetical protein